MYTNKYIWENIYKENFMDETLKRSHFKKIVYLHLILAKRLGNNNKENSTTMYLKSLLSLKW